MSGDTQTSIGHNILAREGSLALHFETLGEMVEQRGDSNATWLILPDSQGESDSARRLTFAECYRQASVIARSFRASGAQPGSVVAILAEDGVQFIGLLLGALLAELVPAPLHLPYFVSHWGEYFARVAAVLRQTGAPILAVSDDLAGSLGKVDVENCRVLSFSAALELGTACPPLSEPFQARPGDCGLLQYSSGSTRTPTGIDLSHHGVLWNMHAIGHVLGADPAVEVALCWLPLFHDMGLTGTLLYSWYWGMPLVLMSPQSFITSPASWLWAISRFRVTGCAAPNFAYALCAATRKIDDAALQGLDLSTWRVALNGAEPVQQETVVAFTKRFGRYGFRDTAMLPVYGLAENVVAACFPAVGTPVRWDRVHRRALEHEGTATRSPPSAEDTRTIASVGSPLPGMAVRVVGQAGDVLGPRRSGEIQLRGPSVMRGYRNEPGETAKVLGENGWLRTGDIGYHDEGELFIVGRSKDVVKKAGAKYDAGDIQSAVALVPGVRAGCVAAFGVEDSRRGTEKLVIVAEARATDEEDLQALAAAICRKVNDVFATRADEVVLLRPGTLAKTTSGKIRTVECRVSFLEGKLSPLWPAPENN